MTPCVCNRCNGPTKLKTITRKKDGAKFEVLECLGQCRNTDNPTYAYTFFPPKENPIPTVQVGNGDKSSGIGHLKEISETLKRIETILANPGRVHISKSEVEPDEDLPF